MYLFETLTILTATLGIIPIIRYLAKKTLKNALDEVYYFKEKTKKNKRKIYNINLINKKIVYLLYILSVLSISILVLINGTKKLDNMVLESFVILLFFLSFGILALELIIGSLELQIKKNGIEYKLKTIIKKQKRW